MIEEKKMIEDRKNIFTQITIMDNNCIEIKN